MSENTPSPQPVMHQHPDDLIKKANRNPEPEKPAEVPPEQEAVEVATLEELKQKLPNLLFGDKPKEPEKKEPETPAPADSKEPEKPAEPAPAEPEKKTNVRKAAPPVDPLEVARETGRAIAESLKPVVNAPEPEIPIDPSVNLSVEDKDTYELFKVLSDSDPRYKGRDKEFLGFVNKLSGYRKKWEKANPGQQFDPSDGDHEDFYTNHQPQFDESDFDKARIRLETRREMDARMTREREDYDRRISELEQKTVVPEVERQAATRSDTAVNTFVSSLTDDTLKEAAKDPEKLKDSDPLAFDILNRAAGAVRQEVAELHKIIHRKNYFDPHNPLHQHLAATIDRQEAAIKQLPTDQQTFQGKRFATRAEFANMTPTQRNQYYMITEDDVVDMLTKSTAADAIKFVDSERKRVEAMAIKYGFTKPAASNQTQKPAATPAAAPAAPRRNSAPAAPSGAALPPTNVPAKQEDDSVEKKLLNSLF